MVKVSTRSLGTPTLIIEEARGGKGKTVRPVHPAAPGGAGADAERAGITGRSGGGQRAPHRAGAAQPLASERGEAGRRDGDLPSLAVRGIRGSRLLPRRPYLRPAGGAAERGRGLGTPSHPRLAGSLIRADVARKIGPAR